MPRHPDDPARRLRLPLVRPDHRRIRPAHRGDKQDERRQHRKDQQPAQPIRRDPQQRARRLGHAETRNTSVTIDSTENKPRNAASPMRRTDRITQRRSGKPEMNSDPHERGDDQQRHGTSPGAGPCATSGAYAPDGVATSTHRHGGNGGDQTHDAPIGRARPGRLIADARSRHDGTVQLPGGRS